jgi:predicted Zn-dependent peptidase
MMNGELADAERSIAEFEKVDREDVMRVINEIFQRKRMCAAMLAPQKEGEAAARRMQSLDF